MHAQTSEQQYVQEMFHVEHKEFFRFSWDFKEDIVRYEVSEVCIGINCCTALIAVVVDVSYRNSSVNWPHTNFMDICSNLHY